MREKTPVKEVCNIAPSGLMTPRDAAVKTAAFVASRAGAWAAETP